MAGLLLGAGRDPCGAGAAAARRTRTRAGKFTMSVQMARQPVEAERLRSTSFDVSRTAGPVSYTATVFALASTTRCISSDRPRTCSARCPTRRPTWGSSSWDVAQGDILGHCDLHLRASPRDRQRASTRRSPDAAPQRRSRGYLGGRERRAGWHRVVLHRTSDPRRESVPNPEPAASLLSSRPTTTSHAVTRRWRATHR